VVIIKPEVRSKKYREVKMQCQRYDAYCGLYCGACEIINVESEQDKERVAKMWGSAPDQVNCSGCKTNTLFIHCGNCKIRNCAQQKGVEFCFECDDYPCSIYEEGKAIIEQLPHLKATIVNQKYIKEKGVQDWLDTQKTKWECPECGAKFAWYTQECKKCHKDLRGIKDYENLSDRDLIF
jgi:ribosomal protein L40E